MVPQFVMALWRQKKLKDLETKRDLLKSRARGCRALLDEIDWIIRKEWEVGKLAQQKKVAQLQRKQMGNFRPDPRLDRVMQQYDPKYYGVLFRFVMTLFRGGSQQGKTQRAKAVKGPEHSLVVNCQGLGKVLPDMSVLNDPEREILAVILDELNWEQVINNKAFFQAGNDFVALSQSVCNQHAYSIWPYGMCLIGCSNDFPMTTKEGLPTKEDEDWLKANVCVIELEEGETWYEQPHTQPKPKFHEAYVSKLEREAVVARAGG